MVALIFTNPNHPLMMAIIVCPRFDYAICACHQTPKTSLLNRHPYLYCPPLGGKCMNVIVIWSLCYYRLMTMKWSIQQTLWKFKPFQDNLSSEYPAQSTTYCIACQRHIILFVFVFTIKFYTFSVYMLKDLDFELATSRRFLRGCEWKCLDSSARECLISVLRLQLHITTHQHHVIRQDWMMRRERRYSSARTQQCNAYRFHFNT